MENPMLSPDPKDGKTENMIQQYAEKVAKALELETNRLKEKTEQDSSRIIAEARDKANGIVEQAKRDAETESEKIIAETKEKSEYIMKESLKKANEEAQRVSAEIIRETREKTIQLITQVIDNSMVQAKNRFVQAASESRSKLENETSRLVDFTKNIENIIGETETKIGAGFEQLTSLMSNIRENLRAPNEPPPNEIINESRVNEYPGNINMADNQATVSPGTESESIDGEKVDELNNQITQPQPEEKENLNIEVSKKPDTFSEASALMKKGLLLLDRTKNKEALEVFNEVIKLEPKNSLAWRKKGAALGRLGKFNDALKAFTKAIELDPTDVTAWQNKITALTKLGRKAEAEEARKGEKQAQQATRRR